MLTVDIVHCNTSCLLHVRGCMVSQSQRTVEPAYRKSRGSAIHEKTRVHHVHFHLRVRVRVGSPHRPHRLNSPPLPTTAVTYSDSAPYAVLCRYTWSSTRLDLYSRHDVDRTSPFASRPGQVQLRFVRHISRINL